MFSVCGFFCFSVDSLLLCVHFVSVLTLLSITFLYRQLIARMQRSFWRRIMRFHHIQKFPTPLNFNYGQRLEKKEDWMEENEDQVEYTVLGH